MSQMKKILHIDRKNRVAMFEPGVTFSELSKAIAPLGLRLNMPLLPRSTKSVTGSLLEREPVLMPVYHWDIADPLACTEVIFGTGEMFRTGAAAGSGSIEEQWAAGGSQKEAAGPSSASWYGLIQGSHGSEQRIGFPALHHRQEIGEHGCSRILNPRYSYAIGRRLE